MGLFAAFASESYTVVLFWSRFLNLIAIFIPVLFLQFVMNFVGRSKEKIILILSGYGISIAYFLFSIFFPSTFIKDVVPKMDFLLYPVAGNLYVFFLLLYMVLVSIGICYLFIAYKNSTNDKKTQIQYLFFAMLIGFSGGATTFPLVFGIPIYPFGSIGVCLLATTFAYAITKHDLMGIKVIINRTGAFFLTVAFFSIGYLALLLPYRYYISSQIDTLFIVGSIAYGSLTVGLYFHRVQRFIQTTAYKKFLNLNYNFEATLKAASLKLVMAQSQQEVLDTISTIQENLEISESYAVLRNAQNTFDCFKINQFERESPDTPLVQMDTWGAEHPLIKHLPVQQSVIRFNTLPFEAQDALNALKVNKKALILAIHSFKELQAVFIFGQKLSEDAYTQEDQALFEVILNQAITVFERITQTKRVLTLNMALEQKVQEAVALAQKHFHQAALASLVMGISHEIRNPMTAIMGASEYVARVFGGKQTQLDEGRPFEGLLKKLDEEENLAHIPWEFWITPDYFMQAVEHSHERAHDLFEHLVRIGLLTPKGALTDKLSLVTFDMKWIEFPSSLEPFKKSILDTIYQAAQMKVLFNFINVVGSQIPRILTITDNMMRYGVSGGGVKKDTFTKIDGLHEKDSEFIFNTFVTHGYLDQKGCVLPPFKGKAQPFLNELKAIFPTEYHRRLEFIVSLIEQTPGAVKKPVNIQDILKSAVSILEGECRKKKIRIIQPLFSEQIPKIIGDEHRLQQAFFNILFNAKQAMETSEAPLDGHQLSVTIAHAPFQSQSGQLIDGIQVQISDTGKGISEETKKKIFDPFFTTKGTTGGKNVGLGLSILREVILNHNGAIDVDSEVGVGTTFSVFLPVYEE